MLRFSIAGVSHRPIEAQWRAKNLFHCERLNLRSEPDNPHDRNAIQIFTMDGLLLGYVPRARNEELLPDLATVSCYWDANAGRVTVEWPEPEPDADAEPV